MNFKPITPNDREVFEKFYKYKAIKNCETAFANLCAYSFIFNGEYTIIDNTLITRIHYEFNKEIAYHCPIGTGDRVKIIEAIIDNSKEKGYKLRFMVDCMSVFKEYFADKFIFEDKRDFFDYVYLRENMEKLSGKKLQAKRNHVNKFLKTYPNYKYINISSYNVKRCVSFAEFWLNEHLKTSPLHKEEYLNELKVINYFADNFDQLQIFAGAIEVDNRIIAFSMGSKVNNETFCTHIEKADKNYDGAYAIINKEFSLSLPKEYKYINREEDLGLEGLRQAKLSYNPEQLIHKTLATII
ncbi:MAG: phosphatidylglycerol lysyltransferase domain-containing protein [Bacteroidales bacterium]|jgi:hypothetical protein|nr:phosphatidylglycerol lysyltransferase domain-containing protein [Bacteroidales bacterium]